jgi:predicted dehydrogenase
MGAKPMTIATDGRHRLAILAPGHFHAALALREAHRRLDNTVRVYAPAGAELEAFLALVEGFNARPRQPTRWRPVVHRGPDWLERALAERTADIAVLAGRNDGKMALIERLHGAGLHVLADKPMLIDGADLPRLEAVLARPPLVLELMTGRHEPGNRALNRLVRSHEVFGGFETSGRQAAISLASTHHLYKLVDGRPLMRPPWFFDVAVQGEGMMDVTTHLVDAVQGLAGGGALRLLAARQWPTPVPRAVFAQVTGRDDFPPGLAGRVDGGELALLCNAYLRFEAGRVPAEIASLWGLAEPPGSGDIQRAVLRGNRATLTLEVSPRTGGRPALRVKPVMPSPGYAQALAAALGELGHAVPATASYRIELAPALRSGHEAHFAMVLDRFLAAVDAGRLPPGEADRCLAKYALLSEARAFSHAAD